MSLRRPLAIALASSVALAGLITVAATSASGAPSTNVQIRVATDDTTVWAAIKTVPLPFVSTVALVDIAVNGWDDTVYVANSVTQRLSVIDGTTGELDDSYVVGAVKAVAVDQNDDTIYTVTSPPAGSNNKVQSRSATDPGSAVTDDTVVSAASLTVDSLDDTVYVSQSSTPGTITYFSGRTPLIDDSENVGGQGAYGIAVDASDDSVWMSLPVDDSVRAWNGRTDVLGSFVGGVGDVPYPVAVNELDDTVYVGNASGCGVACRTIQVVDGRTASVGTPIPIPNGTVDDASLRGIAVDSVRHALYVAIPGASSNFGYINEQQTDDSVFLAPVANGGGSFFANVVAVDDSGANAGLVWALDGQAVSYVMAFSQVDPALVTTTGAAGDAVTVSVASTPTVGFDMDDSAVIGMRFAGTSSVTSVTPGTGDEWSVALPSGLTPGTVSVEVRFNGGKYAYAGDFTVESTPTPTPTPTPRPQPPGAPGPVVAQAGDASAKVAWRAPTSSGSGEVTEYEVASFPSGHSCTTRPPVTSCTVSGLTNGSGYVFKVRAKNYVGWGEWSRYTNMVTPKGDASIVISGTRDRKKPKVIRVSGTTSGLTGSVTPWLKLGSGPFKVEPSVRLNEAGSFRWSYRTRAAAQVYVTQGSVKSNTVTIRAR